MYYAILEKTKQTVPSDKGGWESEMEIRGWDKRRHLRRKKKRERKNTEIRGTDCVALIVIIVVVVHAERKRS